MQGICLRAYPTSAQKNILSQWMGCARTVWNAKCDDERYMTRFALKSCPLGTYAPVDQTYAQYKNKELTPWLFECPSQVLRNAAAHWYQTYRNFITGLCGKPKRKKKTDKGSVLLTAELFEFKENAYGQLELWIGTKKHPVGLLRLKQHRSFKRPRSLRIKRELGVYFVSFCYQEQEALVQDQSTCLEQLAFLKQQSLEYLQAHTVAIDRGVVIAAQTSTTSYDLTPRQLAKKLAKQSYLKQQQRKLAKQPKGSNRRKTTVHNIGKAHQKIRNIRDNFCHQTSHAIVSNPETKVIIIEDLKTRNMTQSAKGDNEKPGKNVSAKAGLNRAIVDKGWHRLETYLGYKAKKYGKSLFKVSAAYTSQECADCGHIHPENRKTQAEFVCVHCGYTAHADRNAADVIKKRAITFILHSGTELSAKGVLVPPRPQVDIGRGERSKTSLGQAQSAVLNETSKKKVKRQHTVAVA